MEDITDGGYTHAKRICKVFKLKDVGEYHHLYIQSDTLLLADVFQNIPNMYVEIYELDPGNFFWHQY